MIKKCISLILALSFLVPAIPTVFASSNARLLYNEDFGSYATNETAVQTINAVSGVDTRVVDDNGEKVLYSRAFGSNVYLKATIAASTAKKTIMSAKIKYEGKITKGKLFSAVFSSGKIDFLTLYPDGTLRLPNGKIADGISRGRYRTITIAVDWSNKTYDVYFDKKLKIDDWKLPTGSFTSAPSTLEWQISQDPDDESALYIDDIRVYEGDVLPWNMNFPVSKNNDNVQEFAPTTFVDKSPKAIKVLDFNSDQLDVNIIYNGGSVGASTLDDGTKAIRLYADDATVSRSYFDVVEPTLASVANYVVDIRFNPVALTETSHVRLFDTKDSENGTWRTGYKVNADGTMNSISAGIGVGNAPQNTWTRLSIIYDLNTFNADVYVNGEYKASHSVTGDYFPTIFRVDHRSESGEVNDFAVDWIRIYTGDKLQDDSFFADSPAQSGESGGLTSVMDPEDKLREALKGNFVLMPSNNTVCYDGAKKTLTDKDESIIVENGAIMVSQKLFEMGSKSNVTYDKSSQLIDIDGKIALKLNDTNATVDGNVVSLGVAPIEKEGILYLPLRSLFENVLGKVVTGDPRGFAVVGNSAMTLTRGHHFLDHYEEWHPIDLIYRYMQFQHPTGTQVVADLKARFSSKEHPRVWYSKDDIEYIHNRIETDEQWRKAADSAISKAKKHLKSNYDTYYKATDSQKSGFAFEFQGIMEDLALAYILTGDEEYAVKASEVMEGFASWDRLAYQYGHLVIGHWAAGMAIGYDVFYNYLSASQNGRDLLKHIREVSDKICYVDHITAYSTGAGPVWPTLQDNFVGVIGGGLITLLLATCDEEDITSDQEYLIENVIKSLEIGTELYWPDGGYYEGVAYTEYHLRNLLLGINALMNTCGTDYGIGDATGFKAAGDFLTYMQTPNTSFAFHDSDNEYYSNNARELIGYMYDNPKVAQMAVEQKKLGGHDMDISSLLYYEKVINKCGEPDVSNEPLDIYYKASDTGTFRNSHTLSNQTFVGFHAGYTKITHDMLDLGQFVFGSDDVVWAIDLGRDSYGLPAYFDNYNIYRKRPEGENCLVINPQIDTERYYGQELGVYTTINSTDFNKPRGAFASVDLTAAYQRDANKYIRGYYFGDNRNTLTVQDEITLKAESELYWFMHTGADVEILSNNKAKLTIDGKTCIVDVYCSAPGYELKQMAPEPLPTSPKVDGQNENKDYTKLAIHYPKVAGDVTIVVKLSPDNGKYTYTPISYLPISNWTVPDGDVVSAPSFDGIYVDGKLIENFMPGKTSYNVDVDFFAQSIPVITAEANGQIVITQAQSFDDKTYVTLKTDYHTDVVCEITFNKVYDRKITMYDELSDVSPTPGVSGTLLKPQSIFGLTLPEPENTPDKMIDDDFGTRATQNGADMWFEFDLGEVTHISGLAIAFYSGDKRNSMFDILYSADGKNFKRVFSGKSSGLTDEYETLAIPGDVRYIRYVGYGNTQGSWNSLTEFRVIK